MAFADLSCALLRRAPVQSRVYHGWQGETPAGKREQAEGHPTSCSPFNRPTRKYGSGVGYMHNRSA